MLVEVRERLTCFEELVAGGLVCWVVQEEQLTCLGVACWVGEELACREELGVVCWVVLEELAF